MKRFSVLFLSSFLTLSILAADEAAEDPKKAFAGRWEYRQKAGDGYDAQGERLEIKIKKDRVQGFYYGLEREGERGLFYSLSEIEDVQFTKKGQMRFTVPERHLFAKFQGSLAKAKKGTSSSGMTKNVLKMVGVVRGNQLLMHCASAEDRCPEETMVFKKGKWNAN